MKPRGPTTEALVLDALKDGAVLSSGALCTLIDRPHPRVCFVLQSLVGMKKIFAAKSYIGTVYTLDPAAVESIEKAGQETAARVRSLHEAQVAAKGRAS